MTPTDMYALLAILAVWGLFIWRVKVEKGWVGIGPAERLALILRIAAARAADGSAVFGRALVALAPAARRVTEAMNDLYVALEESAAKPENEGEDFRSRSEMRP